MQYTWRAFMPRVSWVRYVLRMIPSASGSVRMRPRMPFSDWSVEARYWRLSVEDIRSLL